MKRYLISAFLILTTSGYAQQSESLYPLDYSNRLTTCPNPNTSEDNHEPKSTRSKEASKEGEEKNNNKNSDTKEESDKDPKDKKEEEKPKSPHTFTANVSIVSDYRFRGISQTMRRPAIQGGFDYSHTSGFYLGTWASNVDGTTHVYNNTSMEWDLYGGYTGKPFPCTIPDFAYNFGVIYYYYPGGQERNAEHTRYNTVELYWQLSYKWLSIKYSETVTDYFGINSDHTPFNWSKDRADSPNGNSRGSTYIEANLTFDLIDKVCFRCFQTGKLSLLLHVGHQTVRHYEHLSYTDWRATLTQEFDWFNLFVTYVGTNAKHAYYNVPDNAFHPRKRDLGAQGVVVGAIRTF